MFDDLIFDNRRKTADIALLVSHYCVRLHHLLQPFSSDNLDVICAALAVFLTECKDKKEIHDFDIVRKQSLLQVILKEA